MPRSSALFASREGIVAWPWVMEWPGRQVEVRTSRATFAIARSVKMGLFRRRWWNVILWHSNKPWTLISAAFCYKKWPWRAVITNCDQPQVGKIAARAHVNVCTNSYLVHGKICSGVNSFSFGPQQKADSRANEPTKSNVEVLSTNSLRVSGEQCGGFLARAAASSSRFFESEHSAEKHS